MKGIQCFVFDHELKVKRHITYHVKEYTCKNCKKEFTINGDGLLIELSPKYQEINDVLKRIHRKRVIIKSKKKASSKKANPTNLRIA